MARTKTTARVNFSPDRKQNILDKCGGVCLHCGRKIKVHDTFTVEHFIPLNKGGTNDFRNTVALCEKCNREKRDLIMPVDYYSYAPKLVKEELQEVLKEYCKEHDWLTETNFFVYDGFHIPVNELIHTKNKVFHRTGKVMVRKATAQETLEFLDGYKKGISFEDSLEFPVTEDEAADGIYCIEYRGKTAGFFSTSITKRRITTDFDRKYTQMCALIGLYISPDIKWILAAKQIIADTLNGIIWHLTKSIEYGGTKAAVGVYVTIPESDNRGNDFLDYIEMTDDRYDRTTIKSECSERSYNAAAVNIAVGIDCSQLKKDSFEDFVKISKMYGRQLESRIKKSKGA